MNSDSRQHFILAVHDHGFPCQYLAVDLIQGLRWIAAGRRSHATPGVGVHRFDVRVGIVQRPLYPLQLFALNVQDAVGELADLTSVILVAVTNDDLGYVVDAEAEQLELV